MSEQAQMNQAYEIPLPDLLRIIPKDITIGMQLDHITFGAPYHHIPIGDNCHRAADMIESLNAAIAAKDGEIERLKGLLDGVELIALNDKSGCLSCTAVVNAIVSESRVDLGEKHE